MEGKQSSKVRTARLTACAARLKRQTDISDPSPSPLLSSAGAAGGRLFQARYTVKEGGGRIAREKIEVPYIVQVYCIQAMKSLVYFPDKTSAHVWS